MALEEDAGIESGKRATSTTWNAIRWGVFILLAGFFIYYPIKKRDLLTQILEMSPKDFMVISGLFLANVYATAMALLVLARSKVPSISAQKWCGLHWIGLLYNFLPLKAGMVIRAAYLKKVYQFPYLAFAAVLVGQLLLSLVLSGIVGGTVLFFLEVPPDYLNLVLAGYGAMFLLPMVFWFLPHSLVAFIQNKVPLLGRVLVKPWQAWISFRKNSDALVLATPFVLVTLLVLGARLMFVYRSLGVEMSLLTGLLMATASMALQKMSILPGNLGVREGFLTIIAGLVGVDTQVAFLGSLIDRGVMVLWTFLFGGIHSYLLFGKREKGKPK